MGISICLLQFAPKLPLIQNCKCKTAPLTTGCKRGDRPSHVIQTDSLYNSPVWPVHKPNGKRQLTTDCHCLNANTSPLTAGSTIQEQSKKELQHTLGLQVFWRLRPKDAGRSDRLWDAMTKVNNRWQLNGCPQLMALCHKAPHVLPKNREPDDPKNPSYYPGQPVLVDMPPIGEVSLVLIGPSSSFFSTAGRGIY